MKNQEEQASQKQVIDNRITRTSSNNMLCLVEYQPLTEEEQKKVEELFEVAV